jgi:hypothetical protein
MRALELRNRRRFSMQISLKKLSVGRPRGDFQNKQFLFWVTFKESDGSAVLDVYAGDDFKHAREYIFFLVLRTLIIFSSAHFLQPSHHLFFGFYFA